MAEDALKLIQEWPEPQRTIALELRNIIMETASELEETVKWNAPNYSAEKNICSIICHKNHVNLQFFKGAHLADPQKLMEGTGKSMRHVSVEEPSRVNRPALADLIREAVILDAGA